MGLTGRTFENREHAGRELAALLASTDRAHGDDIVLALPRGGVPVAAIVASHLQLPLDVVVVRKLGAPHEPEVAMGAIASLGGQRVTVRNDDVLRHLGGRADRALGDVTTRESAELDRRERRYRAGRPPLDVEGRRILLVDDGVATGATITAAIEALRAGGAARITVAVPVAPADTLARLRRIADHVVCVSVPDPFWAVGQAYTDFTQTSDDEVVALLSHTDSKRPIDTEQWMPSPGASSAP